jgi:signal transduction histidine kinase
MSDDDLAAQPAAPVASAQQATDADVLSSGVQFKSPAQQRLRAEREWSGAVAALNQLLQQSIESETQTLAGDSNNQGAPVQGLLLSGPFPVLEQADWMTQIATWVFTVGASNEVLQLLPPAEAAAKAPWKAVPTLPLRSDDPMAAEQFCLALTPEFSLVMTLGETEAGQPAFLFSFDPDVVWQVWRSLQARLQLMAPQLVASVKRLVKQFPPVVPPYQLVTQFSRLMLAHLPEPVEVIDRRTSDKRPTDQQAQEPQFQRVEASPAPPLEETADATEPPTADTELLQALAHEVRTPLTTIRTLTRLLLKRKDLNPDVLKRLEVIDRECTEQIDRFNLIFRAAELQTNQFKTALMPLAPISLAQMIQQNISRWQQQASQYSHTLDILLPQKLPMVVTDPTMLDQALTGLIDRITHRLPPGSHIQVQVTPAGNQLKLQLLSQPQDNWAAKDSGKDGRAKIGFAPVVRSIGQMLMFQPDTGSLSLSMAVTKNLFQAIGGKLIVREHPEEGEVLTIFLPLASRKSEE